MAGGLLNSIKAEMTRTKQEITTARARVQSETQVKISIMTIQLTLDAIQRSSGDNLLPEMKQKLQESLAKGLWKAVPESVVSINFDDGSITRESQLPKDQQVSWNLKQIDDHAGMLSLQIGQTWEPVIK
jgi:hypothetical protein